MRPHRLRVTAFGAFAETEQVEFDDLEGLFLLHGETGAGKTTLLDAIAFALYGRVPGERGGARGLRPDHAAARGPPHTARAPPKRKRGPVPPPQRLLLTASPS